MLWTLVISRERSPGIYRQGESGAGPADQRSTAAQLRNTRLCCLVAQPKPIADVREHGAVSDRGDGIEVNVGYRQRGEFHGQFILDVEYRNQIRSP
jgi:hypothetical protein